MGGWEGGGRGEGGRRTRGEGGRREKGGGKDKDVESELLPT